MLTAYNVIQMLDSEKFRTWLKRYDESETVGYTREDGSCPIARYLTNTIFTNKEYRDDFGRVSVSEQTIIIYRSQSYGTLIETDTPHWASMFISKIDELPALYPYYETYEDDETGEEYLSETPSDHIAVGREMATEILDDVIENLIEMQIEIDTELAEEDLVNV